MKCFSVVHRLSFYISSSWQTGDILLLPWSVVRSSAVEPIIRETCYRGPHAFYCGFEDTREMMIEVKYKITGTEKLLNPVFFREFNHHSWHNRLQTPQSPGKKYSDTRVEKKKRLKYGVWEVRPSLRHFVPGYISAFFFQPGDFFRTTWAICLRINTPLHRSQ